MTSSPARILLIEDDAVTALVWRRRLEAQGHQVSVATDGLTGLREAMAHRPDLILLDKELPGLHGLEVCRALRRDPETQLLPILMISADDELDSRVRGLDMGADDYLPKRIAARELESRIRAFLRIKDLQDERQQETDRLATILRNLHEPVVICDQDERILLVSHAFLTLAQLPSDLPPRQPLDAILDHLAVPADVRVRLRVADGKTVTFGARRGEAELTLTCRVAAIRIGGHEDATAFVFRDVTQQVTHERMKADFHSMVAHDLRSPLAVIQGYAALIASGKAGPVTDLQGEFLGHVLQKVDELTRLLNDFLEVSRIEAGFVNLNREVIDLEPLLADALDDLELVTQEKKVAVSVTVEPHHLQLACDPLRLTQILQNLVSNAIKYNVDGGWVRVRARRDDDWVVIEVADGGIGLTPAELAELFRPYRRGRTQREIKGTGLGLVIVKKLVDAHGGNIAVTSRPNDLTLVTLRLPAAIPSAIAPEPTAAR